MHQVSSFYVLSVDHSRLSRDLNDSGCTNKQALRLEAVTANVVISSYIFYMKMARFGKALRFPNRAEGPRFNDPRDPSAQVLRARTCEDAADGRCDANRRRGSGSAGSTCRGSGGGRQRRGHQQGRARSSQEAG